MTQSTFWAEYFVRISDYPFLDVRTEKELGDRIREDDYRFAEAVLPDPC